MSKIYSCLKFLLIFKFMVFVATGQVVIAQPTAGLDELVESMTPEIIATGFKLAEGPVWHPNGYLLFSDVRADTIYKWTTDGKIEKYRTPSNYSNGLVFDKQGRLVACEHSKRRVSRTEKDGTIVTLAIEYGGKRLNSPNDVVIKSDGSIYFTDPTFGLSAPSGIPGSQELAFRGVYRLLPESKTLQLLVDDISVPNGLAFSPDEKVLYIADTSSNKVFAFDVRPDGTLANRRVFIKMSGFPDGIKTDINGNLYVATSYSNIKIYDNTGTYLGDIITPLVMTSNCAFGGPNNTTLFITGESSVCRIQLKIPGLPIITGPDKQ